jgi:Cytochrome P450
VYPVRLASYPSFHSTTAHALAYCLYYVAAHPAVEEKLLQEISKVFGSRRASEQQQRSSSPLTFEQVNQLSYVRCIIMEALRLRPITVGSSRLILAGSTLFTKVPLAKDCVALVHYYSIHRNPAHWEEPERFDPDRHLPERAAARHPYAFVPFGGGSHQCRWWFVVCLCTCFVVSLSVLLCLYALVYICMSTCVRCTSLRLLCVQVCICYARSFLSILLTGGVVPCVSFRAFASPPVGIGQTMAVLEARFVLASFYWRGFRARLLPDHQYKNTDYFTMQDMHDMPLRIIREESQ